MALAKSAKSEVRATSWGSSLIFFLANISSIYIYIYVICICYMYVICMLYVCYMYICYIYAVY